MKPFPVSLSRFTAHGLSTQLSYNNYTISGIGTRIVNPRCACARVTVLVKSQSQSQSQRIIVALFGMIVHTIHYYDESPEK